jgi:hypothetical protein
MSLSGGGGGLLPQEEEAATDADSQAVASKRPYQKPAFRFERVFETMALSCGKVVTTQFQCHFHRKNS